MKLVVWLGNPGMKYKTTRHNIWATMLENFLGWEKIGELKYDNKWKSEILKTDQFWEGVIFCAPQTYMNLSWDAVWPLVKFYKISAENILVLHDEIDFEVWRVAMKKWWSAAWHNGLKNIISKLWTNDFWRIRIWVWRPISSDLVADYVLSKFKPNEKKLITEQADKIFQMVSDFIGCDNLMIIKK